MYRFRVVILIVVSLSLMIAGCDIAFTTPSFSGAYMTPERIGQLPTTTYPPDSDFFLTVLVQNAREDTQIRAEWYRVDTEGGGARELLHENTVAGGGTLQFILPHTEPWTPGQFQVDVYMDNVLKKTVTFEVIPSAEEAPSETPSP